MRELRAMRCECECYHHDVTREEDWQSIVAQTRARWPINRLKAQNKIAAGAMCRRQRRRSS